MKRRIQAAASILLAALAAACSGTATGTQESGNGSNGSPTGSASSPSQSTPAGRCTGKAVPAEKMMDVSSCYAQGGEWHRPTTSPGWCEPPLRADVCAGLTSISGPGSRGDYGKADCIRVLGCQWEAPDGTITQNELLGSKCTGEPKPCSEITFLLECENESNCSWQSGSGSGSCWGATGATRTPCSTNDVGTDPSRMSTHPEQRKFSCIKRGCTFTLPNGTAVSE